MLKDNSPLFLADKMSIPVLIIAAEDDTNVPFKQSKKLAKKLKKLKKPFEFVKIKDAGHNIFYYEEDMELVYRKVDEFLAAHLKSTN